MVWSCAFALGLVWSLLTHSSILLLWLLLAMPGLALPMKNWKSCLPWMLSGWLWGMGLQAWHHSEQWAKLDWVTTEWVCLRPAFLSPVGSVGNKVEVKGIWDGVDADGKRFRCWVKGDSLDHLTTRLALVRFETIQPSDLTSTFDFASYLHSKGVVTYAEVLEWGPTMAESWFGHGTIRLSKAWRSVLHKTFQGHGAPLIWGVFGGDKSALTRSHQWSFQQLGIAHLLAVSGYHVGMMSALFLLTLKAQNRWLKRVSGLGVLAGFVFVVACGNPVSGLRSAGMLTWVWLDVVAGRKGHPWEAMGIMAAITAALDVHQPHMLGTQLSFVATASLLSLRGRGIWWRVPIRAQMGTLALTTRAFDEFPLLFYPVNVLAGPAMLILGALCLGAIAGIPGFDSAAEAFASTMLSLANDLATEFEPTISNRWFAGPTGLLLVVPISLHWLIKRLPCPKRRNLLWLVICLTAGLGSLAVTWIEVGRAKMHWHHLRGKPGSWLVTDGFGAVMWSAEHQEDECHRAASALGLEGPVQWNSWHGATSSHNDRWTQPPFAVWVHRNQFNARSRSVHSLGNLSSASADW